MWEIYLNLEAIARQFEGVVLDTKIFKLPSGDSFAEFSFSSLIY